MHSAWTTALQAHDFTWYGAGDEVHFTYSGPGAVDLRGDSVLAFQRLWNYNHPGDPIAEDGAYGPQTGARIGQSPQDGFAAVPPCAQDDAGVQQDAGGPDDAGAPDDAAPVDDGGAPDGEAADGSEDGGGSHEIATACGCATGPGKASGLHAALALLIAAACWRGRRRR